MRLWDLRTFIYFTTAKRKLMLSGGAWNLEGVAGWALIIFFERAQYPKRISSFNEKMHAERQLNG